MKVSLNHTLPISLYYSIHKVFKSHVKSSQADFLYSSALLMLTAYLFAVLLQLTVIILTACFCHYCSSSLGILLTYIIAEEWTYITGNTCHVITIQPVHWCQLHGHTANTCHVTATYCCVMSPRSRKTQLSLLLRVGPLFTELVPCNALIKSVTICN
jgi:hypothetical protein